MKNLLFDKRFRIPIVMFLAGLILMISANIIFPSSTKGETDKINTTGNSLNGNLSDNYNSYKDLEAKRQELESQIKDFIESIDGVKDAKVIITYENSGELYIKQNTNTSDKSTKEKDAEGGEREVTENTKNEETLYVDGSDGSKYPFVVSEKYAEVRGVAVVLNGGDITIQEKIIRSLEVLLNIPTHKIQVIW